MLDSLACCLQQPWECRCSGCFLFTQLSPLQRLMHPVFCVHCTAHRLMHVLFMKGYKWQCIDTAGSCESTADCWPYPSVLFLAELAKNGPVQVK